MFYVPFLRFHCFRRTTCVNTSFIHYTYNYSPTLTTSDRYLETFAFCRFLMVIETSVPDLSLNKIVLVAIASRITRDLYNLFIPIEYSNPHAKY